MDWEKHLCSCTETVASKRQYSRGTLSYDRAALADFSLKYDVQSDLLDSLVHISLKPSFTR